MRNSARKIAAASAARQLVNDFDLFPKGFDLRELDTALVLGTGWGDTLKLQAVRERSLSLLSGFKQLDVLEGHKRSIIFGRLNNKPIVALSGRVHLNEAPVDESIYKMTRLQIEMLIHLGVKKLILTNAAGSLCSYIKPGDIVVADGFLSLFAGQTPLWGGEFCSPDDVLDSDMRGAAKEASHGLIEAHTGGYAMVRGPFFEGRKYDKLFLRNTGCSVVGMSTFPEACIASLYKDEGVRVVAISFVTNTDSEEHSHQANLKRAKESSAKLGEYLRRLISKI